MKEEIKECIAEKIANGIMIGVQANRYNTVVYNTARNDFNHGHLKRAALEGYREAEKDLALTWEDIRDIVQLGLTMCEGIPHDDVGDATKKYYEEVLRMFNEIRNSK